ncbi:hypothetical protein A3709_12030 [Halioglobus sp. HI00S01]|nr:hypothetical protein A3709_12030 [Halioglobus sp. HI00S01]
MVSFENDQLILVNNEDVSVGKMAKIECHLGSGHLHRGFSVFVFNAAGEVLLQRRSASKMLWPLYWSNACCSHPRYGESDTSAAHRRLREELGIRAELDFIYKFVYRAEYENIGVEHEMCSVWIGMAEAADVRVNENEISDWKFVSMDKLEKDLKTSPDTFTPWMKLEWLRLKNEFATLCPPRWQKRHES